MRNLSRIAILLAFMLAPFAHGQEFPNKPITLYVPFAPGGGTDLSARMLEEGVSKALGQKLVIVNKTGTATIYQVLNSEPDGHTLVMGSTGNLAAQPHNPGVPYKRDDYIPIAQVTAVPALLVAPGNSSIKDMGDVIAAAKNGKSLRMGISPLGSISHLAAIQLERAFNVKFSYIPHKSNGDVMTAILGGHIELGSVDIAAAGPRLVDGSVRGLALFNPTRMADYSNLKTVKEQGADIGFFGFYNVVLAPKGTPDTTVSKLHGAIKQTLEDPAVINRAKSLNLPIAYLGPKDAREAIERSYETFGKLLGELGLKKK